MFHVKHRQLLDVAKWAGLDLGGEQEGQLERYAGWLADEALQAGGIGPDEASHVWERHILDSLMFAAGLGAEEWVLDVGTGVGLPGIPLSIARPETEFLLLDRSGRRVRLIRRIARILGLGNVEVVEADARAWLRNRGPIPCFVMRGVLRPQALLTFGTDHLSPGGTAVVGAGLDPIDLDGFDLVRFPGSSVLEPGRWLRIMRQP